VKALHRYLISLLLVLLPLAAAATDFRSIAVPKAVLFDAPSAQAKKLYLLWQGYPVEIIVNLGDWVKVRDQHGSLTWVEAKNLSQARTVLVVHEQADLHQAPDAASAVVSRLQKDVVLEYMELSGGWVKVRHRDGFVGYVPAVAVWGV
jgi:SH3-like domain-containing protein